VAGTEAVSGVEFVDPLFTGFDEGIDGGAITSGHGSVNDPFVGFLRLLFVAKRCSICGIQE
jgi:hypothetical protein